MNTTHKGAETHTPRTPQGRQIVESYNMLLKKTAILERQLAQREERCRELEGALRMTTNELETALQRMIDTSATDESSDGYIESVALIGTSRTLLTTKLS